MVSTVGISTFVKPSHLLKEKFSTFLSTGISMSARAVHSANIYKDMFSNTGALTLVIFLHSRKRYLPGAVSFGMFSSPVKPQHLKKA